MSSRVVLLALLAALTACQKPLRQEFAVSTDAPARSGLLPVEGGGVVVGNEGGYLVHLAPGGREVWRTRLQREVAVLPALAGDVVVAGSVGGEWVGVALSDGEVRWRQVDAPALTVPLVSLGTRVFHVTPQGGVRALDAPTGSSAWALLPPTRLRAEPPNAPLPAPVVCAGRVVVALGVAGLHALSPEDGEAAWQAGLPDVEGLTCAGDRLLATRTRGQLTALDAGSGVRLWERQVGEGLRGAPVLEGQRAWAWVAPRSLVAVDVSGQGPLVTLETPVELGALPAAGPGLLVLPEGGRQGRLVGVSVPDGKRLFEAQLDSPLRVPPLLRGEAVWALTLDGRVTGLRLRLRAE